MRLQACGVSDYKFGNVTMNNLAAVYKQAAPASCQLAVCARFSTQVLKLPFLHGFDSSCSTQRGEYCCSAARAVVPPVTLHAMLAVSDSHTRPTPRSKAAEAIKHSPCWPAAFSQYNLLKTFSTIHQPPAVHNRCSLSSAEHAAALHQAGQLDDV